MTYETIRYAVSEGIATVTLHRPDKLNAFTPTMQTELIRAFDVADADDEVRVVVVTGTGRAFCAGADLSQGATSFDARANQQTSNGANALTFDKDGRPDYDNEAIRDSGGRLTLRIFECLKPVIAAVNGPAVGIGVTMQLPMDFRLASDSARFGFVFARRGVVPEAASSWFLPRIVSTPQALEWCLTGRIFDAREALAGGLVRSVHPPQSLLPAAYALAREIAENTAPVSAAVTRQMLWRIPSAAHPISAHRVDSRLMLDRGMSADAHEGVESFLQKRPAVYPDRVSRDLPSSYPWWRADEGAW